MSNSCLNGNATARLADVGEEVRRTLLTAMIFIRANNSLIVILRMVMNRVNMMMRATEARHEHNSPQKSTQTCSSSNALVMISINHRLTTQI